MKKITFSLYFILSILILSCEDKMEGPRFDVDRWLGTFQGVDLIIKEKEIGGVCEEPVEVEIKISKYSESNDSLITIDFQMVADRASNRSYILTAIATENSFSLIPEFFLEEENNNDFKTTFTSGSGNYINKTVGNLEIILFETRFFL
jgi:hypothetical protein